MSFLEPHSFRTAQDGKITADLGVMDKFNARNLDI